MEKEVYIQPIQWVRLFGYKEVSEYLEKHGITLKSFEMRKLKTHDATLTVVYDGEREVIQPLQNFLEAIRLEKRERDEI